MADLTEAVQGLPPELFNNVRDMVFTPMTTTVTIDENYQAPTLLRVSKGTRILFVNRFYGSSTFEVNNPTRLLKWLASLSKAHRSLISKLQLNVDVESTGAYAKTPAFLRAYLLPPTRFLEETVRFPMMDTFKLLGLQIKKRAFVIAYKGEIDQASEEWFTEACVALNGWSGTANEFFRAFDFERGVMKKRPGKPDKQ